MRARLYLHHRLELESATDFWSTVTAIPLQQFREAYRAKADPTRRLRKHEHGCISVLYSCSRTHRAVTGLVQALLRSSFLPG